MPVAPVERRVRGREEMVLRLAVNLHFGGAAPLKAALKLFGFGGLALDHRPRQRLDDLHPQAVRTRRGRQLGPAHFSTGY